MSKKKFDCVAMKNKVQEKIYKKTKDMSPDELLDYYVQRSKSNPFFKENTKRQPNISKKTKSDEEAA